MDDRLKLQTKYEFWHRVFGAEAPGKIVPNRVPPKFGRALNWVANGAISVLDFGSENGAALVMFAMRGMKEHLGLDVSSSAVALSRLYARLNASEASLRFIQGGV